MHGAVPVGSSERDEDASMAIDEGPIYTKGKSYRARAEARQRTYRAEVLGVPHGRYGHFLSQAAADAGSNFILEEPVQGDRSACLYVRKKGYAYWKRTDEHSLLAAGALTERGCPFGGSRWQLWVNLALAHEEAARRGAADVRFSVCSSSRNSALLGDGEVLEGFKALLQAPDAVSLLDLDELLAHLQRSAPPTLSGWASGLASRYANI